MPLLHNLIHDLCHICSPRWSKSVSLAKTMVEPVEVGCRIMASSLVPDVKTSFQLLAQL